MKAKTGSFPLEYVLVDGGKTASDDGLVPVRNSVENYNALVKNKVPVAMHLYPTGGHEWFGNTKFTYRSAWQKDLSIWLHQLIAK